MMMVVVVVAANTTKQIHIINANGVTCTFSHAAETAEPQSHIKTRYMDSQ